MVEALSALRNRRRALTWLAIFCAILIVAGITNNGHVAILALGPAFGLIITLVRPWRTAKQFTLLLCASVLGFVIFAILHNVFDALAGQQASAGALRSLLNGLSAATFGLAVFIGFPAILVGAIGTVLMLLQKLYE